MSTTDQPLSLPLDRCQIEQLCCSFSLGSPIAEPRLVTGGLIHRMLRLDTDRGAFAVKVLNPRIAALPNIAVEFRRSEVVASHIAAAGLPAVCALEGTDGTIAEVGGAKALVYPWIDGSALTADPVALSTGYQIGEIIGRIHALAIDTAMFGETNARSISNPEEWNCVLEKGKAAQASWVAEVEELQSSLLEWDRNGVDAWEALGTRRTISHGDLDQKNVLWSDSTPWLIDWESAGPVQPAVEAIAAALDWSGQSVGEPNRATFTAVLNGYRTILDLSAEQCRQALRVRLADWLGWLRANLQRSTDFSRPADERALGGLEVTKTLRTMRALAIQREQWEAWCEWLV